MTLLIGCLPAGGQGKGPWGKPGVGQRRCQRAEGERRSWSLLHRPLLERIRLHDDYPGAHQRVTEAAELGADDGIGADLVRGDVQLRVDPGHEVLLLPEFRDPERV